MEECKEISETTVLGPPRWLRSSYLGYDTGDLMETLVSLELLPARYRDLLIRNLIFP